MRERFRTWGPVALAIALTVLVLCTDVLDKQHTWINMAQYLLNFSSENKLSLEAGDSYGEMNSGPGLTLPAGRYLIKWVVYGDGENRVVLRTSNGADMSVTEIAVGPENMQGEIELELYETAEQFEIIACFEGGTWIDVYDFRLYTPFYKDDAVTFAIAALIFCAVWLQVRKGSWTREQWGRLLLIALAVVFASVPSFKESMIDVYDTQFHAARIYNLADGLRSGQFPVRLGGFSYEGYGALTSVFYADAFLYPSALMLLAGVSIQYVMNLYYIAINALAAVTMYFCAKRIFEERWTAACASILYTLAIYRITDCYVRGALGEATAMSLLPLFLLGMWEVVYGDKRRWPLLMAGATAIFLCHMLATLMCAVLAVGICLLELRRIVREGRLVSIAKALTMTFLLCLFQLVPFVMYSMQGIGASGIVRSVADSAIAPAQLFIWGRGNMGYDPADTMINRQAIEPGLPLLLGAALAVYLLVVRGKEEDGGKQRFALMAVVFGCFAAFMMTNLFPWKLVSLLTQGYSDYLQYAWRLMMFVCLFFALAGGYGFIRLAQKHAEWMTIGVLTLSILFAMPTLDEQARQDSIIRYGETTSPRMITYGEYQLPETNVGRTYDRKPIASDKLKLTDYVKRGTRVAAQVEATEDSVLTLPLFGFDGYAAEVDGQRMALGLGDNNRLTVSLPAGTSGELRVWYEGKAIWRVSDAISLATALALLAGWLKGREKKNTDHAER